MVIELLAFGEVMATWIPLPSEPFIKQPDQLAFLDARRLRICPKCTAEFNITFNLVCPKCSTVGVRKWDRLIIIAGRRFGKSRIGAIAGAEESTIPRTIGWACAPTNEKLHRYVIPAFRQLIPENWVKDWNVEHWDLTLKNDSLIHFQTLLDPDQGRGQGLDWLWIDEICELTVKHWEVIRPSLAGNTVAFFTTTPRGFDWVHKELYKPAESNVPGYWACRTKTSDSANPRITKEFLEREKTQMSDTMYRQEYEADFVIFTGAVYGGLIDSQIVRSEEELKKFIPEWPRIEGWRQILVGIDTGADHPFGGTKIVSTEKGLVVIGEYLERHKSFVEHAGNLKRLANSSNVKWAINKNERQPMIELGQHGIYCQPAENDQVAGIERVKSWLYAKQLWFYEPGCPKTLAQMRALRWAEPATRDGQLRKEKVFKFDDELPDCVRYSCMIWPVLPLAPPPEKEKVRNLQHFLPRFVSVFKG